MSRTPKTITEVAAEPALNEAALAAMGAAPAQLAAIQAGYSEDRDLLNQLLGQAQMASAFSDFSALVRTSKLAYVKENKLYQRLKGMSAPDGTEFTGTWAEFCKLLGRSVDMVDSDIANMKAFGEEALESMSRMGIGYRELRQYRKLPEDQKQALIEVAKAGDKEGFVELAEELISKHAKEKEALKAELEDARDQTDELADSKKSLEKDLADARKQARQFAQAEPDKQVEKLRRQLGDVTSKLEDTLVGQVSHAVDELVKHGDEVDLDQRAWLKGQLSVMLNHLQVLAGRAGIELSVQTDEGQPAWLNTEAIPAAGTEAVQ